MSYHQPFVVECCMILFRTANVPIIPDAEAKGSALITQVPGRDGNVLIAAIGLPEPEVLGGTRYVAWIRNSPLGPVIPIQLLQTGPVITEPGVWVGAFVFGDDQVAPFGDIVVTAEGEPPWITPSLDRIALIGTFEQCIRAPHHKKQCYRR